jgi:glycosyltransferase involved in cell wall biosynthesis
MKIAISVNIPLGKRTGVEEYIYHLLRNLPTIDDFQNHQFFLLAPSTIEELPKELPVKILNWPFKKFWTQIRLSWEIKKNKYDVLFIPAHVRPMINKKIKLVVTIQGLEFEKLPKMYPFLKRKILRWATKRNVKRADKIIVPSKSTMDDLIKFYPDVFKKTGADKIFVVYHGVGNPSSKPSTYKVPYDKYLLYLGRGDKRKNIKGLIRAFKVLKQERLISHKLILVGPNIGYKIPKSLQKDIVCTGYVTDNKKWELLRSADIFVFPSFYEGFGIPILEAQKVGVPVVCSSISSMPEIVWNPAYHEPSAVLVNPYRVKDIARGIYKIIKNPNFGDELIKRGYENVQRFSWPKCAKETLQIILE